MRRRSILSNHYIFTSSPAHTPLFYATGREFCRVDDDEDDDDVILDYYPGSFFGTQHQQQQQQCGQQKGLEARLGLPSFLQGCFALSLNGL